MLGGHTLKHWAHTQSILSLSSGEAEYYGCVRAGSSSMGYKSLLADLAVTGKKLRVKTDASVAKSMAARRGLGGVKHIEVNQLWLQEKVNTGAIEVEKVKGETNRADVLTKFKDGTALQQQLDWTDQRVSFGRHLLAPKLTKKDPLDELIDDDDEEEQL